MTKTFNKSDLAQFTGSEHWFRYGINRNVLFTDGARASVRPAGARLPLLLRALTRRIDHGRAVPFENGTSAVQTFARTRLAIISAKMFFPASDSMAVMNI